MSVPLERDFRNVLVLFYQWWWRRCSFGHRRGVESVLCEVGGVGSRLAPVVDEHDAEVPRDKGQKLRCIELEGFIDGVLSGDKGLSMSKRWGRGGKDQSAAGSHGGRATVGGGRTLQMARFLNFHMSECPPTLFRNGVRGMTGCWLSS
jgi:hypothetical protein